MWLHHIKPAIDPTQQQQGKKAALLAEDYCHCRCFPNLQIWWLLQLNVLSCHINKQTLHFFMRALILFILLRVLAPTRIASKFAWTCRLTVKPKLTGRWTYSKMCVSPTSDWPASVEETRSRWHVPTVATPSSLLLLQSHIHCANDRWKMTTEVKNHES